MLPINNFIGNAKEQLEGKYSKYFMVMFFIILISALISSITFSDSMILNFLISSIISLAVSSLSALYNNMLDLNIAKNKENIFPDINQVLTKALQYTIMFFLITIATYIGFILLIVPGFIVMAYCSQAYYILADNDEKTAVEAIKESIELMKGHVWDFIMLVARLLVYTIPCVFTLGIYLYWAIPRIQITKANFYMYLKELKSNI